MRESVVLMGVGRALRASAACIALLVAQGSSVATASPAVTPDHSACGDSEHRGFDFWVGDWDAYEKNQTSKPVAHAVVELILDRCVLHEIYEADDGNRGESFSIYDASRNSWHQTWVTNHGSDRASDGLVRRARGMWQPVKDGVREVAVRSTDGGITWIPWFDLLFRAHRP